MTTNLHLNDKLIREVVKFGKFRTKREAVNAALQEYIDIQKRRALVDLFGTIEYYPDYDYKKARSRKKVQQP